MTLPLAIDAAVSSDYNKQSTLIILAFAVQQDYDFSVTDGHSRV